MEEPKGTESVMTLEQGRRLTLTGVERVDSFSENAISLTVAGKRVQIAGTGLKILSFSQGNGNFAASGQVASVRFGAAFRLFR